jgi:hypothetical protein
LDTLFRYAASIDAHLSLSAALTDTTPDLER